MSERDKCEGDLQIPFTDPCPLGRAVVNQRNVRSWTDNRGELPCTVEQMKRGLWAALELERQLVSHQLERLL